MLMNRHFFAIVFALLFSLGAAAQDTAKTITVTGKLTRVMAIGGESTGWAVQFDTQSIVEDKSTDSIEVKFKDSKVAEKYAEKRVNVTGIITHRQGIETGDVPVLEVTSIRRAKAPKPTT